MNIETFISLIKGDPDFLIFPYYGIDESTYYKDHEKPCFVPYSKRGYKLGEIVYGNNKPDVSFHVRLEGKVLLKPNDRGLTEFETGRFLVFKMFEAGKPKKDTLICGMSRSTATTLIAAGVKLDRVENLLNEETYTVHLTCIKFEPPVTKKFNVDELLHYTIGDIKTKAQIKVINHFISELRPQGYAPSNSGLASKYDDATLAILTDNSIEDKGFNPKGSYSNSKEKPLFEIKVGGLSNLPTVGDVLKRIDEKKEQTASGYLMVHTASAYRGEKNVDTLQDDVLKKLEAISESYQNKIRDIKWSLYLTDGWFEEFTEKSTHQVKADGYDCTIIYNGRN